MIPTLLLAAGKSSRMGGRDKLLEQVDGTPVLRLLALRALPLGPVIVTLPSEDTARRAILPDGVQIVNVDGQLSDSLRAGIAAVPPQANGVMILPADMPDITSADMTHIHAAATQSGALIVRAATDDGRAGHPIYFDRRLFGRFTDLTGDRGAFRVIIDLADDTLLVPLDGDRARLDLDTPEDWAAYRAR